MSKRTSKKRSYIGPFHYLILGVILVSVSALVLTVNNKNFDKKTQTAQLAAATVSGPLTATLVNPIVPGVLTSLDQWQRFYDGVREMGIKTIIVTQTGSVITSCDAVNPQPAGLGELQNDDKNSITSAIQSGLEVYIGILAFDNTCFNPQHVQADQDVYLEQVKSHLSKLKTFLSTTYIPVPTYSGTTIKLTDSPLFKGFYISPESAITEFDKPIVYNFNQRVAKQIKDMFTGKKVLISPYFADPDITPSTAATKLSVFLQKAPSVDIIAPQDMGAGRPVSTKYISPDKSKLLYSEMSKKFSNYPARSFWANIEPEKYDAVNEQYFPKSDIRDVAAQIDAVKPSVQKIMMWIYQLSFMPASQDLVVSANKNYDIVYSLKRQQLRFDYFARYINADSAFVVKTETNYQNDNVRSVKVYAPDMPVGTYVNATVYYHYNDGKKDIVKNKTIYTKLATFENASAGEKAVRVPLSQLEFYVIGSQVALGVTKI